MKKNLNYIFICLFISFIAFIGFKMNGFCAVALSPSSISQFESFSSAMAQSGFGFQIAPPEIAITELLNNINYNLYDVYGYDLMDLSDDIWNSISDPTEWYNNLTKYASGEYTVDGSRVDTAVANRIAQRISQGALTGAVTAKNLLDAGYRYFSTSVPQWGENAKQFIMGKVDEATHQIVDVAPTMVTKITAQGLAAYNQVYNNLVNSGDIHNMSSGNFLYGKNLSVNYYQGSSHIIYNVNLSSPCYFYSLSVAPSDCACFVDSSFMQYDSSNDIYFMPCNGIFNFSNHIYNLRYLVMRGIDISSVSINNKEYIYGAFAFTETITGSWIVNLNRYTYQLGSYNDVINNLSDNPSLGSSYNYFDSEYSIALKNQLDRLIGHYVDSLTLDRINSIINDLVIGRDYVDGVAVPVAKPTQEVVDELSDVIDDALVLDEDYVIAFDDAYAAEIETTPDPEPIPYPDYTGTAVPDDFPEAPIFDPIVDIVKTPFNFFSIFEPIFQVFGASFNFFSVWLCFPVVLIILLIIWALK